MKTCLNVGLCEDGPAFTGSEEGVGTGEDGVETFDWRETSNLRKRRNTDDKLEMMILLTAILT
jgi:hypothetical protein